MRLTAVVDRFEGDDAVLVLERDGEAVEELPVPRAVLPEDARRQDAVLRVELAEDELVDVSFDPEETERRAEDAQSRFDRLSKRPPKKDEDEDGTGDGGEKRQG